MLVKKKNQIKSNQIRIDRCDVSKRVDGKVNHTRKYIRKAHSYI